MGLQSDVIGFRFGFGYEKGKRTVRAMSNETFNALTQEFISDIYKEHDSTAINYFQSEMGKFIELQNLIIEKTVEIEKAKANRTPSATAEVITSFYDGVRNLGEQTREQGFSWQRLASLLFPFLFSNQEHEHPEDTPIPDAPTGGRTPGSDPRAPDTPEIIPDIPEPSPEAPSGRPPAPIPPEQPKINPSPSKNVFFTLKVFENSSANFPSLLKEFTRTFNYFQWGQAVTAYILTNDFLITKGIKIVNRNDSIATGKFLYKKLRDEYIPKIEAFYKIQLTINTPWKDY